MSDRAKDLDQCLESLVGEVADEFTARLQRGEQPRVEEYVSRHPEIGDVLQQVLPALQALVEPSNPDAEPPSTTAPPRELGDFRINREVGRGGMGIVYEAEQMSLGRRVALKVLPFASTMDPRQLQRFHNEARAAASLHHEHIVPVFAVGCERGVHFYAMQFIEGRSLAQLIAAHDSVSRGRPPSQPAAMPETHAVAAASTEAAPRDTAYFRRIGEWGIEGAEALEHAHALGIVHRDVKPANLIVDEWGKLWVTDFGLARTATDAGLTMSGDLLGTLRYMSPEQALARHGLVDHRTDIYSLGATLYELLTGRPAVEGQDRQVILKRIADEEPRPPRALDRGVPADLETIVLKALAKEPAERYATAKDLADDLHRFLNDRPIVARRPSWLQRLRRRARRHQAAVAAAASTLAVALAVSTGLIWREREGTISALEDAKVQRGRAEERELLGRRQLYAAHIAAARRAWEVADLGVVQRLLGQYVPRPGEEDLRGFEWYYLWGLCRGRKEALLTLRGHTGEVNCVQFSPDGKLLATAGQDHTVRLWDPATGWARAVLRGHEADVNWAAFAPDGDILATVGDDGAVKLWDLTAGQERKQILKAAVPVIGVAFSPDGKVLAAGLSDGTVRWWDFPSGRERPAFRAHSTRIEFVSFSPDSRTLATCAENTKLWDAATGKLQRLLPRVSGELARHDKVSCVGFSHRGGMVATVDVNVHLWEPATGQRLLSMVVSGGTGGAVETVAFSPDDRILAAAGVDGVVRLWDTHTGKLLDLLTGHTSRIWCVTFSPDGRLLASAGVDGTVQLWDPDLRAGRKALSSPPGPHVLAFSRDGKQLIGGRSMFEGGLSIWEVPSGRLKASLPTSWAVLSLALASDGSTLATGHGDGHVTIWDLPEPQLRLTIEADEKVGGLRFSGVHEMAFTRNGKTLLTNDIKSQVVRQWDALTGNLQRVFTPEKVRHVGLAYCPAADLIATAAPHGVVLFDLASGDSQSLAWTDPAVNEGVDRGVDAFSPDATILAGHFNNNVILWDIAARRARPLLLGHRSLVRRLTFLPDGKTLASVGGEVKLWSAHTGQELLSLEDHRGPIHSIAFSPDGRTFATCCLREGSTPEVSLWLIPDGPPPATRP
jgi:WD40 repeat protein/serine/threonine protein kinase